jgi:hypothetical protein
MSSNTFYTWFLQLETSNTGWRENTRAVIYVTLIVNTSLSCWAELSWRDLERNKDASVALRHPESLDYVWQATEMGSADLWQ